MIRATNEHLGMALNRFILEVERHYPNATGALSIALTAIETATKIITSHIRRAGLSDVLGQVGKTNVQGEEVQKLDEIADRILIKHLASSRQFYAIASEENDTAIFPEQGKEGAYVIAMDPLDGSSNIDVNVSVGTIFSIMKRKTGTVNDFYQKASEQVAAGYIIYGSSTMFVYTTGNGVNGFTLDPTVGTFLLSHPDIRIPEEGKIYSVNESNYSKWDNKVQKYIDCLKEQNYTSRYIGSMVSDVHRTLIKGGVFAYPVDSKNENGKLRVCYEVAPMSILVEQAGGKAVTGKDSALDLAPSDLHQRSPIFLGSTKSIDMLNNYL